MTDRLYHGSSIYSEILVPHKAYDWGHEEGCKKAVYATSNKNIAISFALGIVPNAEGEAERIMEPEFGDKMIFWKGTPNYGGVGYLYVLKPIGFVYAGGTQWICEEEVVPEEIIEIKVDEYLHLIRLPTEEEIQMLEKEKYIQSKYDKGTS